MTMNSGMRDTHQWHKARKESIIMHLDYFFENSLHDESKIMPNVMKKDKRTKYSSSTAPAVPFG